MKIIFIGDVLPEKIFSKVSAVNPSTNNVQLGFIECLRELSAGQLTVVSRNWGTSKLGRYPFLTPHRSFTLENGVPIEAIGFLHFRLFKNITALISLTYYLWRKRAKLLKANPDEPVLFVVNNPFYGLALPAFLSKRANDCIITILCEGLDIRYLREASPHRRDNMIHKLHQSLFQRNDGIITFCEESVKIYAPQVPYVTLLHACDSSLFPERHIKKQTSEKILLYVGLISPCYGITALLETMKLLPINFRLIICGGGDDDLTEKIRVASKKEASIQYCGLLPRQEVLRLEQMADVLLMIRTTETPSQCYIAKYCQPSKLPEYMLSGTPILSTDIPAIPEPAKQYLNYTVAEPAQISQAVLSICHDDTEQAQQKALAAKDFAQLHCSTEIQCAAMADFIRKITARKWEKYQHE